MAINQGRHLRQKLIRTMQLSSPLPKTYWGFPVGETRDPNRVDPARGQRGVALILAIMVISVMMLFTTDMILSSQVGLELSVSHRDNVKSEYMAKSALNLATFLLVGDMALDLFLASPQSPVKEAPKDTMGDIWAALNGLPIGGGTAEMMLKTQESFALNKVTDNSVIDQLKLFDGDFTINVSDEAAKINVNKCQGRCKDILTMLVALFSCPAEKAFLEEKKVTPLELASRIKDWIDDKTDAEKDSGFNDENDPYQKRKPPYKAKNAPFDSLAELKMIEGWDDDIHKVFGPYITMWPFSESTNDKPKINLNTTSKELLTCLFPKSREECGEKSAAAFKTRETDKSGLVGPKSDVAAILKDTFCYVPGASEGEGENKTGWFDMRSSVFRVEASGEVGNQRRMITSIIERRLPDKKKDGRASNTALYWRLQ